LSLGGGTKGSDDIIGKISQEELMGRDAAAAYPPSDAQTPTNSGSISPSSGSSKDLTIAALCTMLIAGCLITMRIMTLRRYPVNTCNKSTTFLYFFESVNKTFAHDTNFFRQSFTHFFT
jgi:hypothetical protein